MIPCILYEDEHLLVVNKPAGLNTHRPSPYTTDGIYDWFRHAEEKWENLSTLHRLDKETSGVLCFGKTRLANQSLSDQFARRQIEKTYLLLTDHETPFQKLRVRSLICRQGSSYFARSVPSPLERNDRALLAETGFEVVETAKRCTLLKAYPLTGRTHQIRVHAAWKGFPILGDELYGGTPLGALCLHASRLELFHPATGKAMVFEAPAPFSTKEASGIVSTAISLRKAFLNTQETNAYRVFHGASDGLNGVYLESLADRLLVLTQEASATAEIRSLAKATAAALGVKSIWHKTLLRQPGRELAQEASPVCLWSKNEEAKKNDFEILENGLRFRLSFEAGYSVGLFLDQRENRRRILKNTIVPGFPLRDQTDQTSEPPQMLNAFAYTCAFSVCGARAGFQTTSLDLSRKYLDWGAENMRLNGIDPAGHDFIFGDVFSWRKRLQSKGRSFDFIVLDPPTFSRSKKSGTFKADRDLQKLTQEWIGLLRKNGVILISTNCATLAPADFEEMIWRAARESGRKVLQSHFVTQPIDFAASSEEKAYLKAFWLRLE